MSDDLVKRLREDQPVTQDMASTMQCALQDAAADRIEELELAVRYEADLAQQAEARIEELETKLAKAVEALEWQADAIHNSITVNMKHNHRILLDGIYHEGPLVDWVHKILTGFEAINRTTIAELSSDSCAITKGKQDDR